VSSVLVASGKQISRMLRYGAKVPCGRRCKVTFVGSFDDAIRQHLDLKRRRGADPRVVADLEREAFGHDIEGQGNGGRPLAASAGSGSRESGCAVADWPGEGHYAARRSGLSQETAEIDMDAYINASRIADQHEHRAYDWSIDAVMPDIGDPASSFEWESPTRQRLRGAA
jgi:hypothetical protein